MQKNFTTAKWIAPKGAARDRLGPNAFLDPQDKKFPIRTRDFGPIYVDALHAAIMYATEWGYPLVRERAERLMKEYDEWKRRRRHDGR